MRQSACFAINPITVDNFTALFDCTPVDRASDSMMARPKAIHFSWLGPDKIHNCWLWGIYGFSCLWFSSNYNAISVFKVNYEISSMFCNLGDEKYSPRHPCGPE